VLQCSEGIPYCWQKHRGDLGGAPEIEVERSVQRVGAVVVVLNNVFANKMSGVSFAENDEVIEALIPNGLIFGAVTTLSASTVGSDLSEDTFHDGLEILSERDIVSAL
jgi:DNA integrity scanning protein DisA with diadenylate cyclase activity